MKSLEEKVLIFKALSEPLRIELLRIIKSKERVCVCELTEKTGMSQSKLSYHLKMLLDAGLISIHPEGKWNFYSICIHSFQKIFVCDFISELFSNNS